MTDEEKVLFMIILVAALLTLAGLINAVNNASSRGVIDETGNNNSVSCCDHCTNLHMDYLLDDLLI